MSVNVDEKKYETVAPLSPNNLSKVLGYLTIYKKAYIGELLSVTRLDRINLEEALEFLENPGFYEIESKPVIERSEDELITLVGDKEEISLLKSAYKEMIYPSIKSTHIHL